MLLETKNIKKNDVIIYSRNSMDENYNFRIIFKNDPKLYHRKISFDYTKKLITEYFPKNLIAYRVSSDFPELVIPTSNYGCVILLNGEPELIFTDPVLAVKAIEERLGFNSNDQFRFKIQQAGYSTINKFGSSANFKEEFFFDLNILEAVNQNDEVYLVSLLVKDKRSKYIGNVFDETKRGIIFTPEELKQDTDQFTSDEDKIAIFDSRDKENRQAEGEIAYGDNKLHLSEEPNFRDKSKADNQFIPDEKGVVKRVNRKTQVEIRRDQYKFRVYKIPDKTLLDDGIKNDFRPNVTEDEISEYNKFRRIAVPEPIKLQIVQIEGSGTEKTIEGSLLKKEEDDLFSKFLKSLQKESKLKVKIQNKLKRKRKESDIIQLFKSIKERPIDLRQKGETNLNLESDKNSNNF